MANSSLEERVFDDGRATVLRYLDAIFALGDSFNVDATGLFEGKRNQWAKSTDAVQYLLAELDKSMVCSEAERYEMLLEQAKSYYNQTTPKQLVRWNICISVVGLLAESRSYLPYVKNVKALMKQYNELIEVVEELKDSIKLPMLKEVAQVQSYLSEEPAKLTTRGVYIVELVGRQRLLRENVADRRAELLREAYALTHKGYAFSAARCFGISITDEDEDSYSEILETAVQLHQELLVPIPDPEAKELVDRMHSEIELIQSVLERSVDVKGLGVLWSVVNELNKEAEVDDETNAEEAEPEVSAEASTDEEPEEEVEEDADDADMHTTSAS